MPESRFEEILAQASKRYPDRIEVALVEGLPALARIALAARIARRTQRHFLLQSEFAKQIVERSIRAAEKAACGEPITGEEDQAARDSAVLKACDCEKREGSKAAAEAAGIARLTARCVYGPEIAYGEMYFLADFKLQAAVGEAARGRGVKADEVAQAVHGELDEVRTDMTRLILYAEASGEGWVDPELESPLDCRNDRGWKSRLEGAGIPHGSCDKNRERWLRIHEAIRQAGGCFFPPSVFDPL